MSKVINLSFKLRGDIMGRCCGWGTLAQIYNNYYVVYLEVHTKNINKYSTVN